jgi:DNA polymerase-3 subunit delta
MIAYYCPQKGNPDALAKWLDLRYGWQVRDYFTGMQNFTGMKVMQILGKIRQMDAKSKGLDNPNTPPGELMKELIFFILH